MKAILLFLILASTAIAAPRKPPATPAPFPAEVLPTITQADIEATLRHIQTIAREQAGELDTAKANIEKISGRLDGTLLELSGALTETVKVQASLDAERAAKVRAEKERDEEKAEKEQERKLRKAAEAHVSRIKTWLSVALIGVLLLAVNYLPFGMFPMPMSLYLRIGASAAAVGAGWLIVARFV